MLIYLQGGRNHLDFFHPRSAVKIFFLNVQAEEYIEKFHGRRSVLRCFKALALAEFAGISEGRSRCLKGESYRDGCIIGISESINHGKKGTGRTTAGGYFVNMISQFFGLGDSRFHPFFKFQRHIEDAG